ncbi:hypothetical protein IFM89_021453 [Coptis chinensis]|uniref:J domain-containing protein n=1 Tax=Coptis chinensis TaxID=261450 RepID=A0A835HWK9_9MAGN|nr:hypothetical protein IFM89_021453 [Coptis chinensis]
MAGDDPLRYYSILGIHNDASSSEIRSAYHKLALKWHPDRWTGSKTDDNEVKQRFQQIQDAYTVLSNDGKRLMYDSGFFNPLDDDEEGFGDFMQEILSLMEKERSENEESRKAELQKMLLELMGDPSTKLC